MPGCHREGDLRFCGANTVNVAQQTVFVNGKLWACEGDPNSHMASPNTANGALISIYGRQNIFIGNTKLLAIVAIGDSANTDGQGHPFPPSDPLEGSVNVICYDAEIVGSAT